LKPIFVAAGEASGDLHAAALIRALQARYGGLRFFGLGGEQMRTAGVDLLYDLSALAVAGFWEVAKRLVHFRQVFNTVLDRVDVEKPSLAILIDYPGMNLRLARELKNRGIKVVYYIVPQVWAWKPGRIRQIEERVDLLLSILPFEKKLFDPTKLRCEFVGHPLLDTISIEDSAQTFRVKYKIDPDAKIIALLPGSRELEIERHYRIMLTTVALLQKFHVSVVPFVAIRKEVEASLYVIAENKVGISPVHITEDRYDLLKSASVSLVASGTATLEAALCGRLFCVVYKTGWITYQIAKRLINLKDVGLVNIVAGETIVPEFLQGNMKSENLAAFCRSMLSDPLATETMMRKLSLVRGRLGKPGAAEHAAALIAQEFLR
jgi:lipid-A-disaccharide synthase